MKQLFITILICCLGLWVHAQEPWSLQQCIDYARENNIQIKQQELNEKLSEYALKQSKYSRLPDLNASGSHSYNFGRSIDPTTNLFATERIRANSFSLSSNLVLFNGMIRHNTVKQNQFNLLSDQLMTEKTRNDISLNITSAYLQILVAKEQLGVATDMLALTQKQYDQTSKLVNAGALPQGDLLELQAQMANDNFNVINATNQVELAVLNLKLILDLDIKQPFEVREPDMAIPDPERLEAYNVVELYQTALTTQPQIKSSAYGVKSAERSLAIAKGNLAPSLSLFGALRSNYSNVQQSIIGETSFTPIIGFLSSDNTPVISASPVTVPTFGPKPFGDQITDNFSQAVGISISIPIFNQLQVKNAIHQAEIGILNARYTESLAQNQLKNDIMLAYTNAKAAAKKYAASKSSVEAMELSFEYTQKRFEQGLVNALEFNTGKNSLSQAESDLIQSKYDYLFKLRILDFYQSNKILAP